MNIEMEKHNMIRVLILKILCPEYPKAVDAVLLRRCLADFSYPQSEKSLKSYLAYLQELGCIKVDEKKDYDITMVTITAKGLDILDGRIAEPGIEIK